MDENILSGILKRIDEIKEELNELESKVRQMEAASEEPVKLDAPAEDLPEEPIDLSISVPEISAPSFEDIPQSPVPEDLPEVSEAAPAAEKKHRKKKTVLEAETAEKAVMDVMAEKEAWRTDRPGYPVKNIISAISLNDSADHMIAAVAAIKKQGKSGQRLSVFTPIKHDVLRLFSRGIGQHLPPQCPQNAGFFPFCRCGGRCGSARADLARAAGAFAANSRALGLCTGRCGRGRAFCPFARAR